MLRYFSVLLPVLLGVVSGVVSGAVFADDVPEYKIVLKDQRFTPSSLSIPAGIKVKLRVINEEDYTAEFESNDLNRERTIAPQHTLTLFVGPLEPGEYEFEEEFHDRAKGVIVVQ